MLVKIDLRTLKHVEAATETTFIGGEKWIEFYSSNFPYKYRNDDRIEITSWSYHFPSDTGFPRLEASGTVLGAPDTETIEELAQFCDITVHNDSIPCRVDTPAHWTGKYVKAQIVCRECSTASFVSDLDSYYLADEFETVRCPECQEEIAEDIRYETIDEAMIRGYKNNISKRKK